MIRLCAIAVLALNALLAWPMQAVAADEPIVIVLRVAEPDGCRIWLSHSKAIPDDDFNRLFETLRGWRYDKQDNPNGIYATSTPVIIKPLEDVKWKHVVAAYRAVTKAKYNNVSFAHPDGGGPIGATTPHGDGEQAAAPDAHPPGDDPLGPRIDSEETEATPGQPTTRPAWVGVRGGQAVPVETDQSPRQGVSVYGVGGMARRVVYVLDASSAMADSWPTLVDEMQSSLRKLAFGQRFTVIVFQDGKAIEAALGEAGMVPATAATIARASDWLAPRSANVVPTGTGDPMAAMTRALSYQPNIVFLISGSTAGERGLGADPDALVKAIVDARHKHAPKALINTVQFVHPDEKQTLKSIAKACGGRYRYVDESLLERRPAESAP